MALPSSGTISFGMLHYEIEAGDGTTTQTSETMSSNSTSDKDIVSIAGVYSDQAAGEGSTSRANLLAAPYGMNEFFSYTFNSCVLVGTEITMVDRSVKFVEDLLIDDEVLSMEFPEMTDENYKNFSTETIDLSIQCGACVKTVIFDFLSRYWLINEKLKCTESHPIFAWKDKLQTFEWWQANDLEIGDKLVTQNLKLEEITTMEQLDGDFEIVSLGLRDTYTYFANGYLCHQ